jgi:hypothetical protein
MLASFIQQAKRMRRIHIAISGLSGSILFPHIIP